MKNFGTVVFEEKVYTLTGEAELANTLMENGYQDAKQGEEYRFDMSAPAVDNNGNEYIVIWIFEDTKGSERPLDEFNYNDVTKVVPA